MNRSVIFSLIVGIAGALVLVSLGTWQVQRLAWKQDILAGIEARVSANPVGLPKNPDPTADRYLPVVTEGTVEGHEIHVLVSQKIVGAGYRVISAMDTGGRRVLLDQGIIPLDLKDVARGPVSVQVTGNLHWPDEIDSYTPQPDTGRNIWFARDVDQMAQTLNTEPVLIVARTPVRPGIDPLPINTAGIPNDHLSYAITWFSLAGIWLGMTGLFLWRNRPQRHRADNS